MTFDVIIFPSNLVLPLHGPRLVSGKKSSLIYSFEFDVRSMEKSSLPLLFCVLLVGRPAWTLDLTGIINGVIDEIKPNLTNVNVPEIVLGR